LLVVAKAHKELMAQRAGNRLIYKYEPFLAEITAHGGKNGKRSNSCECGHVRNQGAEGPWVF
jgi:hypothetical protein